MRKIVKVDCRDLYEEYRRASRTSPGFGLEIRAYMDKCIKSEHREYGAIL